MAAGVATPGTDLVEESDRSLSKQIRVLAAAALAAGSAIIGKVGIDQTTPGTTDRVTAGGVGVSVRATLNAASPGTIAAAGDYAANDVLSDAVTDTTGHHWVFANAARANAGSGWITKLRGTLTVDAATPRLRVWFFDADPSTSEKDDNAAFNLTAADRAKCLGYLDLPALTDAGAVSFTQNITDRFRFVCAAASRDLIAIVQTLDAFTNESASMTLDLIATIDWD